MNFKRVSSILYIVLVILTSCDPQITNNDCDSFGYCGLLGGPNYYYDPGQIDYLYPVFNPNNPNEFIAMRVVRAYDTVPEQITLEKFNYINQTHQVILSNEFLINNNLNLCGYDWSGNGWIVLHDCNTNQIFKIQDDGNNLQQLSFGAAGFYACYSPDGNSIFYSDYDNSYLMNANTGAIQDTIFDNYIYPCFSNNGSILCSRNDNMVRLIDTASMSIIDMFVTDPLLTNLMEIEPIVLNTNEVILHSGYSGVYRLNLTTHKVIILKSSCTNRSISNISVSPDGLKILYQLNSYDAPNDPCNIRVKSSFHTMDIDGFNEQILTLP
jgi:hypothetical protein